MNKCILTGNVVRDNDVKDTATTKMLKNTLAVKGSGILKQDI